MRTLISTFPLDDFLRHCEDTFVPMLLLKRSLLQGNRFSLNNRSLLVLKYHGFWLLVFHYEASEWDEEPVPWDSFNIWNLRWMRSCQSVTVPACVCPNTELHTHLLPFLTAFQSQCELSHCLLHVCLVGLLRTLSLGVVLWIICFPVS